jgi:hypothetical protein
MKNISSGSDMRIKSTGVLLKQMERYRDSFLEQLRKKPDEKPPDENLMID